MKRKNAIEAIIMNQNESYEILLGDQINLLPEQFAFEVTLNNSGDWFDSVLLLILESPQISPIKISPSKTSLDLTQEDESPGKIDYIRI